MFQIGFFNNVNPILFFHFLKIFKCWLSKFMNENLPEKDILNTYYLKVMGKYAGQEATVRTGHGTID